MIGYSENEYSDFLIYEKSSLPENEEWIMDDRIDEY